MQHSGNKDANKSHQIFLVVNFVCLWWDKITMKAFFLTVTAAGCCPRVDKHCRHTYLDIGIAGSYAKISTFRAFFEESRAGHRLAPRTTTLLLLLKKINCWNSLKQGKSKSKLTMLSQLVICCIFWFVRNAAVIWYSYQITCLIGLNDLSFKHCHCDVGVHISHMLDLVIFFFWNKWYK